MGMYSRSTAAAGGETRLPANFRNLWLASCFIHLGIWMAKLLVPVAAARQTGSPALVGIVALALTIPWLLVGLQAGALLDRHDRRTLMMVVNGAAVVAILVSAGMSLVGYLSIPVLILAALVIGTATVFTESGMVAMVPMVVEPAHFERANTRLVGVQTTIEIAALPLGGGLAMLGMSLALGVSGGVLLVGVAMLLLLRGSFQVEEAVRAPLVRQIGEGLRFLWENGTLRTISLMAAVINGCWSAWAAVFVLFALRPGPLDLSELGYGLLLTVAAVGGGIGTLLTAGVQRRFGRRSLIGINIGVNSLLFLAPAVTTSLWLLAGAMLVGDMGGPMWGIAVLSMQQRLVPDHLRGRVSSAYRFVSFGALSLGALAGGLVGETLGLTWVFAGGAVITALMFIPFARAITEASMTGETAPAT